MAPPTMDETYGAMFIGLLIATFFQGILTVQAYSYYTNFPDDSRWLQGLVASVWILDATHLGLIAQAAYHYLISNWGSDPELLFTAGTVPLWLQLLFVSLPSLLCQTFFVYRVWVLSKGNYFICGFLACGCLVGFCLEVTIVANILSNRVGAELLQQTRNIEAGCIVLAVGVSVPSPYDEDNDQRIGLVDLLIACSLVWYTRKGVFVDDLDGVHRRTNFILRRVMQYAVATGLTTSLVAFGIMAAFLISPQSFISMACPLYAISFFLGNMYTNALLVSLNARHSLRLAIRQPTINGSNIASLPVHHIETPRNALTHNGEYSLSAMKIRAEFQDFQATSGGEPHAQ
ncbi:hypothetical protein C8F01DRAFT_1348199 [Mycena amicta]|nr:hypothetical protein C8F01DRAFT_1348199 [Mycena amicta]